MFSTANILAHTQIYFSIYFQLQTILFNCLFSIFVSFPASVSNRDSPRLRPMVAFWQHSLIHSILAQSPLQRSRKCHPMEFLACYSISLTRHMMLAIGLRQPKALWEQKTSCLHQAVSRDWEISGSCPETTGNGAGKG